MFGEFLVTYLGARAVQRAGRDRRYQPVRLLAIIIFLAPLLFARQMFQRTHSLQEATDELAVKQAENEYQALHDSLTGHAQPHVLPAAAAGRDRAARASRRRGWP